MSPGRVRFAINEVLLNVFYTTEPSQTGLFYSFIVVIQHVKHHTSNNVLIRVSMCLKNHFKTNATFILLYTSVTYETVFENH